MKKLVNLMLLVLFVFVLWPGQGHAATAPKLFLDGKSIVPDVDPIIVKDYTLVPVSFITNELGSSIEYVAQTKTVSIHNDTTSIELKIDNKTAQVNGQKVDLDASVQLLKGRTMVPLRFVSEQLGLNVDWVQESQSIYLTKKQAPPAEGETPDNGVQPDPLETLDARPVPADAAGVLKGIEFDGTSGVIISYDGEITPGQAFALQGPDRIVLDLPAAAFAPEFTAGFKLAPTGARNGEGKLEVKEHPLLSQVRYNLTESPTTVRVVLDLSQASTYEVAQSDGVIRIELTGKADPDQQTQPPVDQPSDKPNGVFRVVIDAGHGAHDPGAKSVSNRTEKEFNLSLALKVQALLKKEKNIEVYMTREDDTFVELNDRAKFANNLKADIFISIHANSFGTTARGTETYYYSESSKELANIIHKHLVKATGLPDRKVKKKRDLLSLSKRRCRLCSSRADSSPTKRMKKCCMMKRPNSAWLRKLLLESRNTSS